MVKNISFRNNIKNIKTNFSNRIKQYKSFIKFDLPKIEVLKKDIFELSSKDSKPEFLTYNPPVITGKFHSGINDTRFNMFETEFRAYNFEGYDNKFPARYVCIDSKGDRRLKPHVYLQYVEIKPEYAHQGAYKNAVKKLVEAVKYENECEGRIILDARKIESPEMTKIPSPSLAHWKCGFRFVREEENQIMQQVLKGELPLENAPEGTMYYSLI